MVSVPGNETVLELGTRYSRVLREWSKEIPLGPYCSYLAVDVGSAQHLIASAIQEAFLAGATYAKTIQSEPIKIIVSDMTQPLPIPLTQATPMPRVE